MLVEKNNSNDEQQENHNSQRSLERSCRMAFRCLMSERYQLIKAEFLRGRGKNVNTLIQGSGWGILHWACEVMDWEFIVWLVLYEGADVNLLTSSGTDALYIGVGHCYNPRSFIRFLVWQGCDPDYLNVRKRFYHYFLGESLRMTILIGIAKSPLHKDLWREVAGWIPWIMEQNDGI